MVEMTQEKYEEMVDMLLQKAKIVRARHGYSGADKMATCAGIVGSGGESAMLPLFWKDDREKQQTMRALCMTAKSTDAIAVFLIADTRWVRSTEFCEHFKITHPTVADEAGLEEYRRLYLNILKGYSYEIKNLPRSLWGEAVMVALKGPGIAPISRMASYTEGRKDNVEWLQKHPLDDLGNLVTDFNMLPDWWIVQ